MAKSDFQHHSALGIGESYHAPLRNTYRELKVEFPEMNKDILSSMSVQAGNEILGPDGIVTSALVFGEFSTVRTILGPRVPRPTLTERAQAAQRSRKLTTLNLLLQRSNDQSKKKHHPQLIM